MSIENIEMDKQRKALDKDVEKLVDKYIKRMEWDIPDVDDAKALQLILDEIKLSVSRLEKSS
jgi:hypothetical protein